MHPKTTTKPSYAQVLRSPRSQAPSPQSRQVEFNADPHSGGRSPQLQAGAAPASSASEQVRPSTQSQECIIISDGSSPDDEKRALPDSRRRSPRRAAGGGNGAREPTLPAKKDGPEGDSSAPKRTVSPPKRVPNSRRTSRPAAEDAPQAVQPEAAAEQEIIRGDAAPAAEQENSRGDAAPASSEALPPTALIIHNLSEWPQQTLTVRSHNGHDGSDIVQTVFEALVYRYLTSHWLYPAGLPKTQMKMRKLLLKVAGELLFDEDFLLQRPFTPNAMMATSRFGTTPAYLRAAKLALKEGKLVKSFEGDLLLAAVAALHFGVRVLILTSRASEHPVNRVLLDFLPEGIVRERCIVIATAGNGYSWAYPATTVLADVSPDFGEVYGTLVAALPALIEDWQDDSHTSLAQIGHPDRRRRAEPVHDHSAHGGHCGDHDGSHHAEDEELKDEHIALLMEEQPRATLAQVRSALLLTKNDHGVPNLIRANNILLNLFSLEDKHTSIRISTDASVDGTQAASALPAAPANTGKHSTRNFKVRNDEEVSSRSDSSSERSSSDYIPAQDPRSKTLVSKRRRSLVSPAQPGARDIDTNSLNQQHAKDCIKASNSAPAECKPARAHRKSDEDDKDGDHPPPSQPTRAGAALASSTTAATLEQRADQQLSEGDRCQMMEEATAAVIQLSSASYENALARITYHLQFTNVLEEAAERACADLRPPMTELSEGVRFVERLLGRGVRPATIREMAQLHTTAPGVQPSAIRPANLSRRWDDQLAHDSLTRTYGERARLAHRHLTGQLHDTAVQMLQRANQQSGCFETPPATKSPLQAHPNSAVRMAAEREARQASAARDAPVIVVSNNHVKPVLWKQGAEKDSKGFFWSSKLAVQQAWEASNRASGEHAYSTFKSIVHHSMKPVICFELGLSEGQWEELTDSELLCRIDAVLKPRDSTEYFLKLSTLKMSCNPKDGTLAARYRAFAEPFIETLAEATATGMAVNMEQARAAFKAGCSSNHLLKLWLSEQKWPSVAAMHQRLVKGIRLYEADAVLRELEGGGQAHRNTATPPDNAGPRPGSSDENQPGAQTQSGKRQIRPWQQQQQQENARIQQYPQQQRTQSPFQQQQPYFAQPPVPSFVNQATGTLAHNAVVKHPGLDQRGEHWHIPSSMLGCRNDPCTRVFCQVCGAHDHCAEECKRKRHAQANLSGYFSVNRPNTPRLPFDGYPPTPQQQLHSQHQQQPAPPLQAAKPAQHQFAPPPAHYAGGGSSQNHLSLGGGGAAVNHTAQRRFTPVQQQQRQQTGAINHANQAPRVHFADQADASTQQPLSQNQQQQQQ
jgi:hypothetical protein